MMRPWSGIAWSLSSFWPQTLLSCPIDLWQTTQVLRPQAVNSRFDRSTSSLDRELGGRHGPEIVADLSLLA